MQFWEFPQSLFITNLKALHFSISTSMLCIQIEALFKVSTLQSLQSSTQQCNWPAGLSAPFIFGHFIRPSRFTPGDRTRLTWLHTFSHRFGQLRSQSSKHLCSTISKKYTLLEHQQTLTTLILLLSL